MIKLLIFAAFIGLVIYQVSRRMRIAPGPMSRIEAARMLGLPNDADRETVLDAHRRLIARVHPDTGGTAELAARINRARDVMLAR